MLMSGKTLLEGKPGAAEAIRRAQALADAEITARAKAEAADGAVLASLRGNSTSIRAHLHAKKTEHEATHVRSDTARVVTSEKPPVHADSDPVRGSHTDPRLQRVSHAPQVAHHRLTVAPVVMMMSGLLPLLVALWRRFLESWLRQVYVSKCHELK